MRTRVVLLRAIGPATHAKITMRALEAALRQGGLPDCRNLLNTGNLVIRSELTAAQVEKVVLDLLAAHGVATKAVTLDGDRLRALPGLCPDPASSVARPAQVAVTFLGRSLTDAALASIRQRAVVERVERIGDDLWIDYGPSVAALRLTNVFIERATGAVATARNWNTVRRLVDAVQE